MSYPKTRSSEPNGGIAAGSPEGGAEQEVGHLPVMVGRGHRDSRPAFRQPPDRRHPRWSRPCRAASSRPPRLMAASSDSTPTGRPSPGARSGWPASAIGRCCGRPTSANSPTVAPAAGFGAGGRPVPRPGALELPARATWSAASASAPAAGSTCASTRAAAGPAADLLATIDAGELAGLFRRYGEEPFAGRIARTIVERAVRRPVETAEQLAALVERVVPTPKGRRRPPGHARLPGAADRRQRRAGALEAGLAASLALLRPGGRLVVLSYHSLEDRIVKRFIAAEQRGCVCPPEVPDLRLRPQARPALARQVAARRARPSRRQPAVAERPAPRRRAGRGLADRKGGTDEQATPGQPAPDLRPSPARAARSATERRPPAPRLDRRGRSRAGPSRGLAPPDFRPRTSSARGCRLGASTDGRLRGRTAANSRSCHAGAWSPPSSAPRRRRSPRVERVRISCARGAARASSACAIGVIVVAFLLSFFSLVQTVRVSASGLRHGPAQRRVPAAAGPAAAGPLRHRPARPRVGDPPPGDRGRPDAASAADRHAGPLRRRRPMLGRDRLASAACSASCCRSSCCLSRAAWSLRLAYWQVARARPSSTRWPLRPTRSAKRSRPSAAPSTTDRARSCWPRRSTATASSPTCTTSPTPSRKRDTDALVDYLQLTGQRRGRLPQGDDRQGLLRDPGHERRRRTPARTSRMRRRWAR